MSNPSNGIGGTTSSYGRKGRFLRIALLGGCLTLTLSGGVPAEGLPKEDTVTAWSACPGFRIRPSSRTLFLRKAELTEDKNCRTYRTAPMEPGPLELEEQEREKEERSWDMLRNMEIFPRVPHHGENPPVNQPRRKTPHN